MSETIIKLEAATTIAHLGDLHKLFVGAVNDDEVTVDLADVDQLDTAAAQLLAVFSNARQKTGKRITWLGDSAVVDEVLGLLGMGSVRYEP